MNAYYFLKLMAGKKIHTHTPNPDISGNVSVLCIHCSSRSSLVWRFETLEEEEASLPLNSSFVAGPIQAGKSCSLATAFSLQGLQWVGLKRNGGMEGQNPRSWGISDHQTVQTGAAHQTTSRKLFNQQSVGHLGKDSEPQLSCRWWEAREGCKKGTF
jgi:hypothetical protein